MSDGLGKRSFGGTVQVRMLYSTVSLGGDHMSIEAIFAQSGFGQSAVPGITGLGPVYRATQVTPFPTAEGNEMMLVVRTPQVPDAFI